MTQPIRIKPQPTVREEPTLKRKEPEPKELVIETDLKVANAEVEDSDSDSSSNSDSKSKSLKKEASIIRRPSGGDDGNDGTIEGDGTVVTMQVIPPY